MLIVMRLYRDTGKCRAAVMIQVFHLSQSSPLNIFLQPASFTHLDSLPALWKSFSFCPLECPIHKENENLKM